MKIITQQSSLLIVIILISMMKYSNCLTGSQIASKCHCDLTKSFCDFGCCCDLDCGGVIFYNNTISVSCFNQKSQKYCPKSQFFYSIKGDKQALNTCYYYNTSQILIDQKTLSLTQRTQYINKNKQLIPIQVIDIFIPNFYLQSTIPSGYTGYKLSSILSISSKTQFSFTSSSGQCLIPTQTSTQKISFRFGHNIKITCLSTSTINPLMFSQILGKSVNKYYNVNEEVVRIPSISGTINTLIVNFIIGEYGSQGVKYIDRITYSYTLGVTTKKTLSFNFIDSNTIKKQQNSAPFFPQIPSDMFYPIHMMS